MPDGPQRAVIAMLFRNFVTLKGGPGGKERGEGEGAPTHGLPHCILLTKDGRDVEGYAVEKWPDDFTDTDGGMIDELGDESVYKINIEAIGGVDGGTRWYRPEDSAIRDVEAAPKAYYVSENGRSVWVIVAKHNGRKYLKTETDHYLWDNLLALPECP